MGSGFDSAHRPTVQHFDGGRGNSFGGNGGDRLSGGLDRIKDCEQRFHRLRQARQLNRDLRHDAERPFRADEKSGEVIATAIGRFAPKLRGPAIGQDNLQPGNMVHRHTVGKGMRAARIF